MTARQLISGSSYGPDTLKVLFRAFDDAWKIMADSFGDEPAAIQAARLELANTILSLAGRDTSDAEEIKNLALQIMAHQVRTPSA